MTPRSTLQAPVDESDTDYSTVVTSRRNEVDVA
jgi:hypothetical protein